MIHSRKLRRGREKARITVTKFLDVVLGALVGQPSQPDDVFVSVVSVIAVPVSVAVLVPTLRPLQFAVLGLKD